MKAQETILITGAGGGIGLALSKLLCERGYKVIAGLRSMADADKLPASATGLSLDVTDAQQIRDAVAYVHNAGLKVKALINNAGIYAGGAFETMPAANIQRLFDVNFFGAIAVTRAFLPLFRQQRSGQIHFLSSLSGLLGLPGDGIYAASKHAIEAASESLSLELAQWNINVLLLEPGAYETGLLKHSASDEKGDLYSSMLPDGEGEGHAPSAEDAAKEIADLIECPPPHLRCPIGDQARAVTASISGLSQQERRNFIIKAAGVESWVSGAKED